MVKRCILAHIVRGCGYVPGYGDHPGTATVAVLIVIGALAGCHAGWRGAIFGAVGMTVVFGPMYLWGAYSRSVEASRLHSNGKEG